MNKIKKKRLIRTIKYKKDTAKRNKNKGRVMCSVLTFSAITIQLKLNGEKR